MRLRIATGTNLPGLPPAGGMVTLHRESGLIVEATPDVRAVKIGDARSVFVGGDVVGMHGRAGEVHAADIAARAVRDLVSEATIESARDTLEGRFVIGAVSD